MPNRKSQGLPITTIIVAALGILVLVVVAAIFGAQIGKFGRVAGECPGRCAGNYTLGGQPIVPKGEECIEGIEKNLGSRYIKPGQTGGVGKDTIFCVQCCVPIG